MPASFITRTRLLPYHGTVNVQEGDWVQTGDVVAELEYVPGVLTKVHAARQLSIKPTDLTAHMRRSLGERVERGDLLASSLIFGEAKQAHSSTGGYIGLISNSLGTVYVRQPVPVGSNQPVQIDLLQELQLSKLALIPALRVRPPQVVAHGQVLAMTTGVKGKVVASPIYGRVESVADGVITIIPTHARTQLNAYLTGRVERVIPRQGVEVRAYAHSITGAYGVGGESQGEILLAAASDAELTANAVTSAWQGKIVVAGRTAAVELLQAASQVGCAGVVIGHLSSEKLAAYVGKASQTGFAGEDELLMPVMLTERFSPAAIRSAVWQGLQQLQGRQASMSGRTQIRAGLVRPEVVVCESVWPQDTPESGMDGGELQVGDLVRVLRGNWLDRSGRVVELPPERRTIATGARVRVVQVDLDGQLVTVALANLLKLTEGRKDR